VTGHPTPNRPDRTLAARAAATPTPATADDAEPPPLTDVERAGITAWLGPDHPALNVLGKVGPTLPPDSYAHHPRFKAMVEAVAAAERARIQTSLAPALLAAFRCIPDGEIRNGCVINDGAQVRERLRVAWRGITDEPEAAAAADRLIDDVLADPPAEGSGP
jgi:hypothetical protein